MTGREDVQEHRKGRFRLALVIGILVGLVAVGLVVWLASHFMPARDNPNRTIRIGYSPYILNLPVFVAKEKGFFGVRQVEMIPFQTTDSMTTALIRGDIDAASALGTEVLIRLNENEQRTLIARPVLFNTFRQDAWTEAILVASDRDEIASIKDLDGKSIGTLPAATAVAYCRLIAEHHGISFSAILKIKPSEALPALSSKRVDALLAVEPQIAFGTKTGMARVLLVAPVASSLHDPMLVGAHCVSQARIEADPEFGPLFYDALSRATQFIREHRIEALAVAVKYVHMPEDVLQSTQLPDWVPAGAAEDMDLRFIVELFAREGILEDSRIRDDLLYVPHH